MKKILLALSIAIGLTATSCSSDVSDTTSTVNYVTLNLVAPADGSSPYITASIYAFAFNLTQLNVSVNMQGLTYDNVSYTFSTDTVKYQGMNIQTDGGVGSLIRMTNMKGYLKGDLNRPVRNLNCDINGVFYWYNQTVPGITSAVMSSTNPMMVVMQYDVQDMFSVKTIQPEAFFLGKTTAVSLAEGTSYSTENTICRVRVNSDYKTADFIIYNAQYTDNDDSKVSAIVLEKLPFQFTDGGYSFTASNVVPKVYVNSSQSGGPAENEAYKIKSFRFNTTNNTLTKARLEYEIEGKYQVSVPEMAYVIDPK